MTILVFLWLDTMIFVFPDGPPPRFAGLTFAVWLVSLVMSLVLDALLINRLRR